MVSSAPTLSDGVVLLDGYRLADVAAHLAGEDDETARRFGWWPEVSTEESVRRAIADWQEQWRSRGAQRTFAIRRSNSGELAGGCQVRQADNGVGFVSYWISATHRGARLATRAVCLLCQYAHTVLDLQVLEAHIEPDNTGSIQVALRAGFSHAEEYVDPDGTTMNRLVACRPCERPGLRTC